MEFISEAMHAAIDLGRPTVPHDVSSSSSASYSATTTIYNHNNHQDQQRSQQQQQQHQQLNTNVMIYYRGFADGNNPQAPSHSSAYPPGPDHAFQDLSSRSATTEALVANGNAGGGHFENGANSLRLLSLTENPSEGSTGGGGTGVLPPYPIYLSDPSQYSTVLAAHQQPLHHHGHDVNYHHPSSYLQVQSLTHQLQDQLDFSSFAHPSYPTTIVQQHNQQPSEAFLNSNKSELGSPDSILPDSVSSHRKRTHSNTSETASEGQQDVASDPLPACSVCNDISSGVHYGVWACEGCKGFFRRAMSRKPSEPPFACYYALNCDVNRENRNKCRACRLRRCQEAGMVYGGSKEGKRRRNSISSASHPMTEFHMPIELQWKEYVVAAHTATFTPVSEIFMSRFASVISLSAADLWPNGSDIGKRGCQTIQLFATALPFFGCLPTELRTKLLEMNSLDIMILRVAYRFCPEREAFLFPPGTEVTMNCLAATHLGADITNRLATLGRAMIRLGVGSEEVAFLSTLALFSTDSIIICDNAHANILRDIENNVLKAFQAYMAQRWVSRPTLVGKLIMLLLDVRMIQYSAPISIWLDPKHPPPQQIAATTS